MSRSLVYLLALASCWLVACPAVHDADAGVVASDAHALDAFSPDVFALDAHTVDASLGMDADNGDAALDALEHDAFHGDAASDAFTCSCDDGIACTFDSCDSSGACVHWSMCASTEACLPSGTCAPTASCITSADCVVNQPCQELLGCMRGRCAYRWNVDRDGDGALDMGCGGNDCAPSDRTIPRAETCNRFDDDCNGLIDDIAGADTDSLNCGGCNISCAARRLEICIAGECACTAEHARCAERPSPVFAPDGCYDLQTDALHCGSCDLACPEGSTCEAGLCRYRAAWMHGVDVVGSFYRRSLTVTPNGDVVFEVVGRPTQLFHHDRPTEAIPSAPRPFARHVVRLDRDGNLVGVTSIPSVTPNNEHDVDPLAVTNDGFYFGGNLPVETELLGVTYSSLTPVLGYVPRSTGTIAWARPVAAQGIVAFGATLGGSVAMLVQAPSDARPFERRALRVITSAGVELPHDDRTGVGLMENVLLVFASQAGGFVLVTTLTSEAEFSFVPISGAIRYSSYALIYGEDGQLREAVGLGPLYNPARIYAERPDGSAWLVQDFVLVEADRAERRSLARPRGFADFADFDGEGVAHIDTSAGEGLVRSRDLAIVERVQLPGPVFMRSGSVWLANGAGTPNFSLPGATTTIARIDLPPIP